MILKRLAIAALCFCLWNCGWLFKEPAPFIPAPTQLNPDSAFSKGSTLSYSWQEGWSHGKQDTSLLARTFQVVNQGDTVFPADTVVRLRLHFSATDAYPLPGSVITHLGFNPSKVVFDTVAIPDPGPSLAFPLIPEAGWRDTLSSGDFHYVRELTGFDTISWHGAHVESWAFADTIYWNGVAVSTAIYSMARSGLLQLSVQRPGFNAHGDTTSSLLWLKVMQK